jgi:periplasmic protein CpxP/Spy
MSRRLIPFAVLFTFAGIAGLSTVAWAGSKVVRGHGFQHFRAMHGPHADHEAQARAMLEDVLGEIDATDEQSVAILAIADDTHGQLEVLHGGLEEHHAQVAAVLTAETVDREAIEELRLDAVAGFDQVTQLVSGAMGDVAELLTVEQRLELAAMAEELHGD